MSWRRGRVLVPAAVAAFVLVVAMPGLSELLVVRMWDYSATHSTLFLTGTGVNRVDGDAEHGATGAMGASENVSTGTRIG